MKISVAPISYFWPRDQVFSFYEEIEASAADIVYLGETICAKRRQLKTSDWIDLAKRLSDAGKQVVLSTLALNVSESDLKRLDKICNNSDFLVEANDMSAIALLEGRAFVSGHSVNVYNANTLSWLAARGLCRWVLPVELGEQALSDILAQGPQHIESEVLVFGRLPLAYSARCYTARAHNLQKDQCGFRCLDYPQGMLLDTQESQSFLVLNGIQTQSAATCNLLSKLNVMERMGVDVARVEPQPEGTGEVLQIARNMLNGDLSEAEMESLITAYASEGMCDGYWRGDAGYLHQATGR